MTADHDLPLRPELDVSAHITVLAQHQQGLSRHDNVASFADGTAVAIFELPVDLKVDALPQLNSRVFESAPRLLGHSEASELPHPSIDGAHRLTVVSS
jgi:hypothetical protein